MRRVEFQGALDRSTRSGLLFLGGLRSHGEDCRLDVRKGGPGEGELRVEINRLLVKLRLLPSAAEAPAELTATELLRLHEKRVGLHVVGRPPIERSLLAGAEGNVQFTSNPVRDVGLNLEHVGEGGVEGLVPDRNRSLTWADVDELRTESDPARAVVVSLPTNSCRQQVAHPEIIGNLTWSLG